MAAGNRPQTRVECLGRILGRAQLPTYRPLRPAASNQAGPIQSEKEAVQKGFRPATMKVKILESNSPPLREGARIRQISEDQAKLLFECEDVSTLDVTVVDPGNSVSVRDKNNQVEYLG
jgi:hypothetical protein